MTSAVKVTKKTITTVIITFKSSDHTYYHYTTPPHHLLHDIRGKYSGEVEKVHLVSVFELGYPANHSALLQHFTSLTLTYMHRCSQVVLEGLKSQPV